MLEDTQFIETPITGVPIAPSRLDNTFIAHNEPAPMLSDPDHLLQRPEANSPTVADLANPSDQWLKEERSQYWINVLRANPVGQEYLTFKKLDPILAKEAGAHLDEKSTITEVTPDFLVSLEEKMYVLIELARRNLEESKRFNDFKTLSSSEIVQRLQDMVGSEPESDQAKRVSDLLRDKSATIGALHDVLVESETNAAYECLEKAHAAAGFLNDIRSGHASKSLLNDQPQPGAAQVISPAPQMASAPVAA